MNIGERHKRLFHLALGLMLLMSVTMVMPRQTTAQEDDDRSLANARAVSVENLVESDPGTYLGDVVTFVGQVEDVISPRIITVEGDGTSDAVPVAAPVEIMPADLGRNATVVVTGTVKQFDLPPISEAGDDGGDEGDDVDVGEEDDSRFLFTGDELDIDPDALLYEDFYRDPIIVATDITIVTAGSSDPVDISLPDLLSNLNANIGSHLSLAAQVGDIVDEYAFTVNVEGSEDELLVVGIGAFPRTLSSDAIVRVSGAIEVLDLDDEDGWRRGDTNVYLEDDVFEEFEGRPVLVAGTVRKLVPVLGATTERILDNPEDWFGRQVTLLNDIAEVRSEQVFSLEGTDGFLGLTGTDLLVLMSPGMVPTDRLSNDAIANVYGTVQPFSADAIDFASLGLDHDDLFSDLDDGDPVIVATEVTLLTTGVGATVEDILDETDDYTGQTVTLTGTVDEVLNEHAFTLDGTEALFGLLEENLLVVGSTEELPAASLQPDVLVVVTGEVQYLTPDAIDEQALNLDLDADPLADRAGDPVVVLGAVTIVAVE